MYKNLLIAVIIGNLLVYLPCWQWESASQQIFGAFILSCVALVIQLGVMEFIEKALLLFSKKGLRHK